MRWESGIFFALALIATAVVGLSCSRAAAADPPVDGAALFAATCARCHGPDGHGGPPAAPGQPAPRNLSDAEFQSTRTDAELRAVIVAGKGNAMPPWGAVYSAEQIDALVTHVRRLRGK